MVAVRDFLARVVEICSESPAYAKGHSGSDGLCDCIGLIIGAIRRAGGQWHGMHGSNYAARNEVEQLQKITHSGTLIPGELVFKAYEPGEKGYDLPARYKKDLRDYYHVGVVVSASPLRIYHMTTPCPKIDTKLGKWAWHGWPTKIAREGEIPMGETYQAIVIGGGALNMRKEPKRSSQLIRQIPEGAVVDVLSVSADGAWGTVEYRGSRGYAMMEYLSREGEKIEVPKKKLEEIYDMLGDWLGRRG